MTDNLDVLLGTWDLTGRTRTADHDDITGTLTATRLLDGLLHLTGAMNIRGKEIRSLEIIWPDEAAFASHVYTGPGSPLSYRWSRAGSVLTHAGMGMTYTGAISPDGATITGSWEPDPDRPDMAHAAYDATMRRLT